MKHKIFCLIIIVALFSAPVLSQAVTASSSTPATASELRELRLLLAQVKRLLSTLQQLSASLARNNRGNQNGQPFGNNNSGGNQSGGQSGNQSGNQGGSSGSPLSQLISSLLGGGQGGAGSSQQAGAGQYYDDAETQPPSTTGQANLTIDQAIANLPSVAPGMVSNEDGPGVESPGPLAPYQDLATPEAINTKVQRATIDTIVIHSCFNDSQEDTPSFDGSKVFWVKGVQIAWKNSKAGAHYLIAHSGTIHSVVPETQVASHAGISKMPDAFNAPNGNNPVNARSIGIEMIYMPDKGLRTGAVPFRANDEQTVPSGFEYQALNRLITEIKGRNNEIKYAVLHCQIAGVASGVVGRGGDHPYKKDPENFDWTKIKETLDKLSIKYISQNCEQSGNDKTVKK